MREKEYFDYYKPAYSKDRTAPVLDYLKNYHGFSICEFGVGDAVSLKEIAKVSQNAEFSGIEQSEQYLKDWPFNKKNFYIGSVLDDRFLSGIRKKFDYVLIGYTLHHLVSSSRKSSIGSVEKCLENAKKILNQDGKILILEPIFEPFWLMSILFYIKRFFCFFSVKRIGVFGYWNNIGAPVVSYLSQKKLESVIKNVDLDIELQTDNVSKKRFFQHLLGFKRLDTFLVLSSPKKQKRK